MAVSVIVPARNAGAALDRVLAAIAAGGPPSMEIIVVDDGSSDGTDAIAQRAGCRVVRLAGGNSAARARNEGARISAGDILFFVDADVLVPPGAIGKAAGVFESRPDVQALFGSYDDQPEARDFFSQYRNLFHHYIHQHSSPEARTFWCGFGAMRREAFESMGGFSGRFRGASIEDVELGLRLSQAGGRILLAKDLQVKHLKRWTLGSILRTDIFRRAVPWTGLVREHGLPGDLNFRPADRLSGAVAVLLAVAMLAGFAWAPFWWLAAFCAAFLLTVNRRLYGFFRRKRGALFGLGAVLMHWLYLCYSSATFAICSLPRVLSLLPGMRRT